MREDIKDKSKKRREQRERKKEREAAEEAEKKRVEKEKKETKNRQNRESRLRLKLQRQDQMNTPGLVQGASGLQQGPPSSGGYAHASPHAAAAHVVLASTPRHRPPLAPLVGTFTPRSGRISSMAASTPSQQRTPYHSTPRVPITPQEQQFMSDVVGKVVYETRGTNQELLSAIILKSMEFVASQMVQNSRETRNGVLGLLR